MPAVTMPRLSDAMETGTIVRWLVAEGAHVEVGDDLVEIETDKATMTYRAETTGAVHRRAPEGTTARLGEPIAVIGADPGPAAAATNGRAPGRPRVAASPAARAAAARLDVDLEAVTGTGPAGRVVLADVHRVASTVAPPLEGMEPAADGDDVAVRLTAVQLAIARRTLEAKEAPEFVVERDVAVDAILAERARMQASGLDAPSLTDVVVKAAALALRGHPRVNASWRDGTVVEHGHVNVGVAIAAPGSLLVPVLRDADAMPLGRIAWIARELARQARTGSLPPGAMQGGTFTVSDLGGLGVEAFTAILNPPQAAIVAVGAIREVPTIADGGLVARQVVRLRLTCDHRVLYGADAAAFLADLARYVETPLALAS